MLQGASGQVDMAQVLLSNCADCLVVVLQVAAGCQPGQLTWLGMLQDPKRRWTATQLLQHPFIRKYDCLRRMTGLKQELASAMELCMASPRA